MHKLYTLTPDGTAALDDSSAVVFLVFPSGHDIRLDILMRAEAFMPGMEYGRDYTLREMCDPVWWDANVPKGHRTTGGATFAFLVAQGVFPLEFACHPERSNKIYRRV